MRIQLPLTLALIASSLLPTVASAQEPAGAFTGHFAVSGPSFDDLGDLGGGLMADVTAELDWFRIGGALGVVGVSSDIAERSRVSMPVTISMAAVGRSASGVWFEARVRGGFWAGAINQGLAVGGFFSTGAFVGYAIGQNVAIGAGLDFWFALGHGDTIAVAPGLTLAWVPWSEDY